MMRRKQSLSFSLNRNHSPYKYATIHVSPSLVNTLFEYVIYAQQKKHRSMGFSRGNTPIAYIEQAYHTHIIKHLKEFLFNYCVADFLVQKIRSYRCVLAEKPIPEKITLDRENGAYYVFKLYENPPQQKSDWKKPTLTQPGRKRYKDIDRQVRDFLAHEVREQSDHTTIQQGDWILLRMIVLDDHKICDVPNYVWLKIGKEQTDRSAHALFINQPIKSCFTTFSPFLEQYLSEQLDTEYPLGVEIIDRVPGDIFSLQLFKHHFYTRNADTTQQTLTQVFSYRNDISQRREIIDKTFKHLFKHFHVMLNDYLIEQQRKHVIDDLHENPDYYVYKAQSDFKEKVYLLAKKQLKETMIIDYICYTEGISVTEKDLRAYLNLMQRPRTKSFIYFALPRTQVNGQETPISFDTVRQACLREKTLNHVIRNIFNT